MTWGHKKENRWWQNKINFEHVEFKGSVRELSQNILQSVEYMGLHVRIEKLNIQIWQLPLNLMGEGFSLVERCHFWNTSPSIHLPYIWSFERKNWECETQHLSCSFILGGILSIEARAAEWCHVCALEQSVFTEWTTVVYCCCAREWVGSSLLHWSSLFGVSHFQIYGHSKKMALSII